jgi:hypothetical protein
MRPVEAKLRVSAPKWRARGKRHGKGKPFIDKYLKRELYRDMGEDHDAERLIDRKRNIYKEIVKDPKTGRIIHHCWELLDYHVGRGYAKRNKRN